MNTTSVFRAMVVLSTLIALAAVPLSPVQGQEKAPEKGKEEKKPKELRPSELKMTTERVIVFKDGYCLFVKKGVAKPDAQGEVFTEAVPDAAVLGSFWATPKDGRLVSMNAGTVTTDEKTTKAIACTQHIEILEANKGKNATVELEGNQTLSGVIRQVLTQETSAPPPESVLATLPHRSGLAAMSHAMARHSGDASPVGDKVVISGVSGSLFVLETTDGDVVIPVTQIRRLTVKGLKLTNDRTVTTTRTAKRLTFRFEKGDAERELAIMYFVPGIRWIPTYRAQLAADDAKDPAAQLVLQAELLNECEDLNDVSVDLVVGVPNFRFKNTISPFSLEATIRNALAEAAPQIMGQQQIMSNAMFTQRAGEFSRRAGGGDGGEGGIATLPPELVAAGTQDLFVYKLPKITLDKGHRAAVPIFTTSAPSKSFYSWDLHLKRHDLETAPGGGAKVSPLVLSKNEVWHQLELANKTQLPWTTGAVMLMQGQQPLAQELLTYTSAGSVVRVPVTVSVDTRGSFTEKETGRMLRALQWDGYQYARIEKQGTLTLTNNKSIAVEVEITCRLGGHADEVSNDGTITLAAFDNNDWTQYHGNPAVNNHSHVTWRVKLKPGETVSPTVKYHYFTRH